MGAGIVQLAAQTGHEVIACDSEVKALEKAQLYVRDGLSRFADRGAFFEEEAGEHYDRIHWTVNPEEMAGVGAAIEAIVEKVDAKKEAFAALDEILPSDALLLTNTSSISITDLASATSRPERVEALIGSFGKVPVVLKKDVPGFVANRFLMPMLLEAARLLEEGVATKEEIDLLVKKGIGFPVGPFELGDFIGLDVALDVLSYVHEELGEPYYAPPRVL